MAAALDWLCLDTALKMRFSYLNRNEWSIYFSLFFFLKKINTKLSYSQKNMEPNRHRGLKRKNYSTTGDLVHSSFLPTEEKRDDIMLETENVLTVPYQLMLSPALPFDEDAAITAE